MIGSAAKWAMRSSAPVAASLVAGALTLAPMAASANPMDLAPERLTKTQCDPASASPCGTIPSNQFTPDNAAWARLVSQYAMAIAPNPMHPARTTGYGGFELSLFGTVTTVDNGADWMKRGTEGAIAGGKYPSSNANPDGVLQVYGVSGRKGLPYGFELEGSVGYMANTELVVMGGGVRWAILEGFRTGALGYLPDISIGGYVNTLTGTQKVKITVPSADAEASYAITLAKQVVFQPYVGFQLLWIDADSGVVDATPGTNVLSNCNARPPTPSEMSGGYDGQMICQHRNPDGTYGPATQADNNAKLDVNNNMVFQNVRFRRQRLFVGTALRYELIDVILHASFDVASPESGGDSRIAGLATQMTFGAMIGTSW